MSELVAEYLAQHEAEPRTIAKLRWLLAKATCAFGERRVVELRSEEIAAWRTTLPEGHRFEATQALRQVLNRAVAWRILDSNPARAGVDNPRRQHPEMRPFESWAEIDALAEQLGPVYGPIIVYWPIIVFAAATGLRPGEWIALEDRDLDREARVVYVRRAFAHGRLQRTKTAEHACGAAAGDRAGGTRPAAGASGHAAPVPGAARRLSRPAQLPAPRLETGPTRRRDRALRRPYDLRHTFATFALRAGISTFDLSRFMGASLTMIDHHYGHLARDGRAHAAALLDSLAADDAPTAAWTFGGRRHEQSEGS